MTVNDEYYSKKWASGIGKYSFLRTKVTCRTVPEAGSVEGEGVIRAPVHYECPAGCEDGVLPGDVPLPVPLHAHHHPVEHRHAPVAALEAQGGAEGGVEVVQLDNLDQVTLATPSHALAPLHLEPHPHQPALAS